MKKVIISAATALTLSTTALAFGPEVEFDVANGVIAGTGCSDITHALEGKDNTLRLINGGLVLDMTGRWSENASRISCTVRVPARIPAGYYINDLETITLIASRNYGNAAVGFIPKVDGYTDLPSQSIRLPKGRLISELFEFQDLSDSRSKLCNGEENEIMVGGTYAITGRKDSPTDKIFVVLGDWNWETVGADLFRLNLKRCHVTPVYPY